MQDSLTESQCDGNNLLILKLNYKRQVFFSSSIYLPETFYQWKNWKSKKLGPPTFKTDIIKVGLIFSISNFFVKKSSPANKWMSSSYSNSALRFQSITKQLVCYFVADLSGRLSYESTFVHCLDVLGFVKWVCKFCECDSLCA